MSESLKSEFTIALDAMGGDLGPEIVILAAKESLEKHESLRIVFFGTKAIWGMTKIARPDFLIVVSGGLVIISATIVTSLERSSNPELGSFPDALWWAIVTITTVGYGNQEPVTFFGRIVAVILMITGVGFFGAIAANLAAFFVRKDEDEKIDKLQRDINAINEKLDKLAKK